MAENGPNRPFFDLATQFSQHTDLGGQNKSHHAMRLVLTFQMMYGLPGFANLADTTSQRGGGEGWVVVEINVSQLLLETVRSRPVFDAESESVHHLALRCLVCELQLT